VQEGDGSIRNGFPAVGGVVLCALPLGCGALFEKLLYGVLKAYALKFYAKVVVNPKKGCIFASALAT
jgi:hypothetical protein